MGIPLTKIEKEFVFKSLRAENIHLYIHGPKWQVQCKLLDFSDFDLKIEIIKGDSNEIKEGDEIEIFFSFQNNHLTFSSNIKDKKTNYLVLSSPDEVFKDSHRGYRRIKVFEKLKIYFYLKSTKYVLNFPKLKYRFPAKKPTLAKDFNPKAISQLIQNFKEKMDKSVSEHKIVMLRDRNSENYEEELMINIGKIIWIPSTEKNLPDFMPFDEEQVLTKGDLLKYEETSNTPEYNIESKIKNFIFQKKINEIYSEVYCPIIYNEYLVGYIYVCNKKELKKEIQKELVDYIDQFTKVLCFSLSENGYFKNRTKEEEAEFEAPIIDISASGLLFTQGSEKMDEKLFIFKELEINIKLNGRKIIVDSWIIRKFNDEYRYYYGIQFRKLNADDFCYLYEYLYKKPFKPKGKYIW